MYTPNDLPDCITDEIDDLLLFEGIAHADWLDLPEGTSIQDAIRILNDEGTVKCYDNADEKEVELTHGKIREGLCKWLNEEGEERTGHDFINIDAIEAGDIIQIGLFGQVDYD